MSLQPVPPHAKTKESLISGMSNNPQTHLAEIARQFQIDGELQDAEPYGSGHINDTYLARYRAPAGTARFVHQRINQHVFKQPQQVMENIQRVCEHARTQILSSGGDALRETLTLVPARDGRMFTIDSAGSTWRTYLYVDGTLTYDRAPRLQAVYQAAHAFGSFQRLLASLPGERLHETIPNFHHTRLRLNTFVDALHADAANRAGGVKREVNFLLKREADAAVIVDLLAQGRLPERVTHNDTKINNVLFDEASGQALCVIDLDTVMPGSALYDFGDMVRAGAARSAEDEPDVSKAGLEVALFTQLARGYVRAARDFLTPAEFELLAFSAKLITYEQALRFLGDYLNGDTYYKIQRPNQNLDRARTQIKLITDMEKQMGVMEAIIDRCRNEESIP
jgi:Ser/Thr protein kinase RdoA (MazF antagonist)